MNVLDFRRMKEEGRRISMVTCYDSTSAAIVERSSVDCILVGDSLAMTMHGHPNTLAATTELLALHTRAVARGAPGKFIIADMPFLSFRKGLKEAMDCVQALAAAGAHAVKLEGVAGHEEIVRHIVDSGVPVMGHLGLTPQSIHQLGGMKVQARSEAAADLLLGDARRLELAGCFGLVLECVPSGAAAMVTKSLAVPTIGIGAGVECDGQVLVFQDLLGLNPDFRPKFLRTYLDGFALIRGALNRYDEETKARTFPGESESYA